MSAMRIILLILALAVVAFVARYALTGTTGDDGPGKSRPAQQLDNVRERTHQLEGELQRGADRADQSADKSP